MPIAKSKLAAADAPRVLVVDDEPVLVELFQDLLDSQPRCHVLFASTLSEAREILSAQMVNLLVTDVHLPDGDGLTLLPELQRLQPGAAALVVTGHPDMAGAISAMRGGAVDFVPKPFSAEQIRQRVRHALDVQRVRLRQEARLDKLKSAVRRLNEARRVVSKKVDLLCNDLINAYGELSRQLDLVRVQEGFRQFVTRAADLEQLLCHTMDWLLRQVGYCNIGIWLTDTEQGQQLGAYMKYTIAAEPDLVEALQKNLLRIAVRRGFIRLREPELAQTLTPVELKYLGNQDLVAINCNYLGENVATMAIYRDGKTPFSDDDIASMKSILPLFALELARLVRSASDDEEEQGGETTVDDDNPPKPGKKDPADWWKSGGEPPF